MWTGHLRRQFDVRRTGGLIINAQNTQQTAVARALLQHFECTPLFISVAVVFKNFVNKYKLDFLLYPYLRAFRDPSGMKAASGRRRAGRLALNRLSIYGIGKIACQHKSNYFPFATKDH